MNVLTQRKPAPYSLAAPRSRHRTYTSRLGSVAYHAVLIALCFLILLPLIWMISSSLKTNNQIFVYPPQFFPHHPHWSNYPAALRYIDFWRYFANSLLIAAFTVAGTLFSCTLTAYSFSRLRWPGRNLLFGICMATLMLPFQVQMIPLYIIYFHLHWIGTFLPLIVPPFFGNALYIFLLRQFFLTIPRDLSDAAIVDGAGPLRTFWSVIIPLIRPALAVVAVFSFLDAWQDFLAPLIYLDDPSTYTLSLGLQLYYSVHQTAWAYLMCASVVFTLPSVVLFFVAQRTFSRGITLTGLKG
ncbi:MAG TPA: carbohydrate ABC transporter permease [Chloroflexota bacterium]|nr:carbohydrate ABC transporter permease [Chloroflexota bacterium]